MYPLIYNPNCEQKFPSLIYVRTIRKMEIAMDTGMDMQAFFKPKAVVPREKPRADNVLDDDRLPSTTDEGSDSEKDAAAPVKYVGSDDPFCPFSDTDDERDAQYLYCKEVCVSDGQRLTVQKILKRIQGYKKGYEMLTGACVPYYDFEIEYNNLKEGKSRWELDFKIALDGVSNKFPDGKIYMWDASGRTIKKDEKIWKNSYHFLVRGAGYYEAGEFVPQIEGFDSSVYKPAGKKQKFRLPYCSKDGRTRFLKRVIYDEDCDMFEKYDDMSAALEDLEEEYEDWIIQNVSGEELVKVVKKEVKRKKTKHIVQKDADDLTEEKLAALLDCYLDAEGNQDFEWEPWIHVVWAVCYCGFRSQLDYEKIIHAWSSKSDKYDETTTQNAIDRAWKDEVDCKAAPLDIGSLIKWAKEINPIALGDWMKQYPSKYYGFNRSDPYVWYDFQSYFRNKTFESKAQLYEDLRTHTPRILGKVLCGGGSFVKKDDCEEKMYSIIPFVTKGIDFYIRYNTVKTINKKVDDPDAKGKKKTRKKTITEDIEVVERMAASELINEVVPMYDKIVWDPSEKASVRSFNTWQGFKATEVSEVDPTKFDKILWHMEHIICGGNKGYYEFLLEVLAAVVQYPDIPPKVAVFLYSVPGTGKNMFVDFIRQYVIGDDASHISTGVENATKHFNAHLLGKKMIVVNECSRSEEHYRSNFDKLKSYITDDKIDIIKKGIDGFTTKCALFWMMMSNHKDGLIIDKGDRRFFALEVSKAKKKNDTYFKELAEQMNGDAGNHFYTMLKQREGVRKQLDIYVPMTPLKREIIGVSLPSYLAFLEDLKMRVDMQQQDDSDSKDGEGSDDEYDYVPNKYKGAELYAAYKTYCEMNGYKYPLSSRKFLCEIKVNITKKHTKKGNVYLAESITIE